MDGCPCLALLRTRSLDVTVAKEIELEVVKKALSWPTRQIAINAGEDGSVVVGKIMEKDQYGYGFDSQTGEYGTWSPRASSTRPRWSAPRSRMPPPWRRS